ncbi:MAG: hypothetical protein AB1405_11025, partial [Bdellovibrionota bacterium]
MQPRIVLQVQRGQSGPVVAPVEIKNPTKETWKLEKAQFRGLVATLPKPKLVQRLLGARSAVTHFPAGQTIKFPLAIEVAELMPQFREATLEYALLLSKKGGELSELRGSVVLEYEGEAAAASSSARWKCGALDVEVKAACESGASFQTSAEPLRKWGKSEETHAKCDHDVDATARARAVAHCNAGPGGVEISFDHEQEAQGGYSLPRTCKERGPQAFCIGRGSVSGKIAASLKVPENFTEPLVLGVEAGGCPARLREGGPRISLTGPGGANIPLKTGTRLPNGTTDLLVALSGTAEAEGAGNRGIPFKAAAGEKCKIRLQAVREGFGDLLIRPGEPAFVIVDGNRLGLLPLGEREVSFTVPAGKETKV